MMNMIDDELGTNFVEKEAITTIVDEREKIDLREETTGLTGAETSRGTADGVEITEISIAEGEIAPADR